MLNVYVFIYERIINRGSELGIWKGLFQFSRLVYYFVTSLVNVPSCLYALDINSHLNVTSCGIARVQLKCLSADDEFAFLEGFSRMLSKLGRNFPLPVSLILPYFLVYERDAINSAERRDLQIVGQEWLDITGNDIGGLGS